MLQMIYISFPLNPISHKSWISLPYDAELEAFRDVSLGKCDRRRQTGNMLTDVFILSAKHEVSREISVLKARKYHLK